VQKELCVMWCSVVTVSHFLWLVGFGQF